MPVTCVIGLQWGDEAKGKIVDILTGGHEIVVRYQGGANAGHTIVVGTTKYKLSLVPSGILRPGVQCVITGGVVIHPARLQEEIDRLRSQGVEISDNLLMSDRAHVIFPWHLEEERIAAVDPDSADPTVSENGQKNGRAGPEPIGTTMRGIGPCYRDKAGRTQAIRLGDLYRPDLRERIQRIAAEKNTVLAALRPGHFQPLDPQAIYQEYCEHAERLRPHVGDTTELLLSAVEANGKVLFEGAQGALLDIDHGTYPYVTSSNSSGVGISSGSGVPARYFSQVIGILKAYNTRVGGGPFPTELHDATGELIRQRGQEFGTVTGRPRRCGWFDAVAARYTARLSGVDSLALMLLDVLDELPEVKICTAYEIDGRQTTTFPSHVDDLARVRPIFETLPGWQQDLTGVRSLGDLPPRAIAYVERIGQVIGRPVQIVSVGPARDQTIFAEDDQALARA